MNNDIISIVVPIYNVEQYIHKCIESIINQTYKNIEVILVDDGSPDKCGEICNEYAKKDKRIKVIHKKNGGLSDARNFGLEEAKGKYITFIDSDDYIESTYVEKLYNAIIINDVKMAQCGIITVNNEKQEITKNGYIENQNKRGKDLLYDLYKGHMLENTVVWNKLYEKTLFTDLRYPVGKIHEDEFTTYKILYNLEKVSIINDYLYYYRQSNDSIIRRKFNLNRLDVIEAFEERVEFFDKENEKELQDLTVENLLYNIRHNYMKTKVYIENSNKIQKILVKKYRKYYKKIIFSKHIKLKKKINLTTFYLMPRTFHTIKNCRVIINNKIVKGEKNDT